MWYAALLGGLIEICGSLVGRVLVSLGMGYVAYSGLDTSLGWIKTQISTSFAGLPAQALAVLGAAHMGSVVAIVLSALTARLVLDGMTSGTMKRLVVK